MEWRKILKAATTPLIVSFLFFLLIAAVLLGMILRVLPTNGITRDDFISVTFFVDLIIKAIFLLICMWAGYRAVKKFKLDIKSAALIGFLTGGITGFLGGLLTILFYIEWMSLEPKGPGIGPEGGGVLIFGFIIAFVVYTFAVSFTLAIMGGLFGTFGGLLQMYILPELTQKNKK